MKKNEKGLFNFSINRYFLLIIMISCFLLQSSQLHADEIKKITIATDDHPPLLQTNPSNKFEPGIMTDIVREVFKNRGIQVQYLSVPAARISWSLLTGKVSAVVGPIGWFSERNYEKINYVPVYPATFHFFYMKKKFPNGFDYVHLEELKGFKIGYMYGGACTSLLENAGLKIEKVNDRNQNTRKLFLGRIDLLVTESLGGWASIKKLYPEKMNTFEISENIILQAPGCIILKKDQKKLIQSFQQGFKAIKQNGTYHKILTQYFEHHKIPKKILDETDDGSYID